MVFCMIRQIECVVKGRVQRVMYRHTVKEEAKKRGLVGMVRNLPNETVQVIAQGEESVLKDFMEKLKVGSSLSRVEDVYVEWQEPIGLFNDFSVDYANVFDRVRSYVHRAVN
jgi:acylphosphatase